MEKPNSLPDSPSFVDLCTLHQHAMRYYRLWIYACNTVLAIATLVFTVFAVAVLVDPRITLLSGVELYDPTFVYAYVALVLQCGVLQTIGCLGALRLNQRLLNTYWTLLLLLMIGDIVVGLVWALRLDGIKSDLRPSLRQRLRTDYGVDPEFTQVWDWVQAHEICCGIDSPNDFHLNESIGQIDEAGAGTSPPTLLPLIHRLPSSCCTFTKKDSTLGRERRLDEHQAGTVNSNYARHHHSGGHDSKFDSKRHSHTHQVPQSSGSGMRRIPRGTSVFSKESSNPSLAAFAARNRQLPPNSTLMKTDKNSKRLTPKSKLRPRLTPSPPSPSAESNPVMRSDEVQSACELPPEYITPTISPTVPMLITSPVTPRNFPSPSSVSSSLPVTTSQIPTFKDKGTQYPTHLNLNFHIHQHRHGCADKILAWVDNVTDILFVIGFCIIVFLKGCFLAILRYEIKEMIQKIRLLNGEETSRGGAMNELIGLTSMYNSNSPEEIGGDEVPCDAMELKSISPSDPLDDSTKTFLHHQHHQNACGGGAVLGNNTIGDGPGDGKPARKGYPPFGNYLNSNNMMYRLQRQMSQQQQQEEVEEDVESCSALLQLTRRKSNGGGEKRNSVSSRLANSVSIPVPRNGNNNSMPSTTTALVGSTSLTGAAPLTTSAAASVQS